MGKYCKFNPRGIIDVVKEMMALFGKYADAVQLLLMVILVFSAMLLVILGCQAPTSIIQTEETPSVTATTPLSVTSPAAENVSDGNISTSTPTAMITDGTINLVMWTVEEVSSEAEGEIGDFISNSLRAFRRNNPNLEIEVILKKTNGKGGVLDFLRTAREVAPAILPDVAVIAATDLNQAYANSLIQPLDGKLDRSIVQDLLPAARRMGTINDDLAGVPIDLEMQHTVYNGLTFAEAPLLWSDVLTANTKYLFPAKGINGLVNVHTLAQYFSAGGKLLDNEGSPAIDERVLRDVLEFYRQGVENGTIDPTLLDAAMIEELWPIYLEGRAGIAQTTVRQYLADRELFNNTHFAPLPVRSKKDIPVHVINGWVLVLITDGEDMQRQAAALSLIEWFMSTNNNATWNKINKSIPTRGASYQQLAGDDPYWIFLSEQLNTAQPQPGFVGYDQLGRILQQAVAQVIRGEATPEEATATAIDALGQ